MKKPFFCWSFSIIFIFFRIFRCPEINWRPKNEVVLLLPCKTGNWWWWRSKTGFYDCVSVRCCFSNVQLQDDVSNKRPKTISSPATATEHIHDIFQQQRHGLHTKTEGSWTHCILPHNKVRTNCRSHRHDYSSAPLRSLLCCCSISEDFPGEDIVLHVVWRMKMEEDESVVR